MTDLPHRGRCAFCGGSGPLVRTCALDEKWSRRFGGEAVVSLDHGWYTTPAGERVEAPRIYPGVHHDPHLEVLCAPCATGWVEEVRWRAEPELLALAQGQSPAGRSGVLVRWAVLTAMLAELLEGMPTACTDAQRAAVRRGEAPEGTTAWFFSTSQRRPARLHLSQVQVDPTSRSLVQVVTLDVAHLTVVVVMASCGPAAEVVGRAALVTELGEPSTDAAPLPGGSARLDLARTPHPHEVAVHRLCSTAMATQAGLREHPHPSP